MFHRLSRFLFSSLCFELQTLSGGVTLPDVVDFPSISQSGQFSNNDFHSPVRGDLRDICTNGWQGHRPCATEELVVEDTIASDILICMSISLESINENDD